MELRPKSTRHLGRHWERKKRTRRRANWKQFRILIHELGCDSPLDDSIRYQLLHRTVSAILTARSFHAGIAVMLVHSFSQDSRWREDFEAFAAAISGNRVTTDLYEIELGEGPRLIIGWCKGAEKYLSVELPGAFSTHYK